MQSRTGIDQHHIVGRQGLRVGHTVRIGGRLAEQHNLECRASIHAAGDMGCVQKCLYLASVDASAQNPPRQPMNLQGDGLGL